MFDNGIFSGLQNWKAMLIDGIHFTNLGATFMFKLLWPWVEARTKDLPQLLPQSQDIDVDDPEKSLTQGGNPWTEYSLYDMSSIASDNGHLKILSWIFLD